MSLSFLLATSSSSGLSPASQRQASFGVVHLSLNSFFIALASILLALRMSWGVIHIPEFCSVA